MRLSDLLRELALPLVNPAAFFSLLFFLLCYEIASLGFLFSFVLGMVLAANLLALVLPALSRTLLQLLEARSMGREPAPPVVEFFSWVGHAWTLFPLLHAAVFTYALFFAGSSAAYGVAIVHALLLPASLIVLAITHSVCESLRPGAVIGLIRRCGIRYLAGPLFLMAALALVRWVDVNFGIGLLTEFLAAYLVFAAFALFGGMVRPLQLALELEIPEPIDTDEETLQQIREAERVGTLNHVYGLISRGNARAGFAHLYRALATDADAAGSWAWYFNRMLCWENTDAALIFAERYFDYLVQNGERVAAKKLLLCCQLVDPAFRPDRD